jgi:long-chain acyl-CoA synthetase
MVSAGTPGPDGGGRSRVQESTGPSFGLEPGTLVDLFLGGAHRHADAVAMRIRRGAGEWDERTHARVEERVRSLALGLRSLGLERGARVGILSRTRAEWAECDFGLIMSGLVGVPVYPSLPSEQVAYVLGDAGVRAVFAEDQSQYDKLVEARPELPRLERVFSFEPVDAAAELPVQGLSDLVARGDAGEADLDAYEAYARATGPDDLATLIYTSGTTGTPKGVMLTHHNLYSNALLCAEVLPLSEEDRHLSWLPLSHIFERTAGHYVMWHRGVSVSYAESVDTIVRDLGEVRPTISTGVPYLYDKIYERAQKAAHEGGGLKLAIFRWARRVGEERADRVLAHADVGVWLGLRYRLADRLVFSRLRERTGGRLRYFVSGGGPLSPTVARFMWAAGLPILEGYGLTETSPVLTVNPPGATKLGTVGPPIPETALRIAEDGEILCRGPQVMKGYFRNEEATREAFTADGWLRTGDIGSLDEDGYLSITDRKKELLVTAGGKNVAPAPVERAVERSRFVAHAVLVGDKRNFPIVVVQPAFENVGEWARRRGVEATDPAGLIAARPVQELIDRQVHGRTEDFDHHEKPGWILLVPDVFGVETGELTPTLKVKRRVIDDRYAGAIDRAYRAADERRDQGGEGPGVTVAEAASGQSG